MTTTTYCAACQAKESPAALMRCSVCRSVNYCGVACQKQHWATHKSICTKVATYHLVEAIGKGDLATVTRLAKHKRVVIGHVDYVTEQWTPLHECTQKRALDTMEILINRGAKVNAKDGDGETALFLACSMPDSHELVVRLLAAGANPNIGAKDGWSCLMMAVRDHPDPNTTTALLEAGANPLAAGDMFGRTAIDLVSGMLKNEIGISLYPGEDETEKRAKWVTVLRILRDFVAGGR